MVTGRADLEDALKMATKPRRSATIWSGLVVAVAVAVISIGAPKMSFTSQDDGATSSTVAGVPLAVGGAQQ
jgi:hypothetical protein